MQCDIGCLRSEASHLYSQIKGVLILSHFDLIDLPLEIVCSTRYFLNFTLRRNSVR